MKRSSMLLVGARKTPKPDNNQPIVENFSLFSSTLTLGDPKRFVEHRKADIPTIASNNQNTMNTTASFRISKRESAIDLTWILAAATMLCTLLSPLECRAGVSPVVLQDFVEWEKQHRGSRI